MFGTAGANLATASTTSSVSEVLNLDNIGIVVNWAGSSPVGALTIQASNDQLTWVSLDFGSTIDISGDSGSHIIDIAQLPYAYLRAVYTKASGTGTLFASLACKQIGG
jgi:hypothetical protein